MEQLAHVKLLVRPEQLPTRTSSGGQSRLSHAWQVKPFETMVHWPRWKRLEPHRALEQFWQAASLAPPRTELKVPCGHLCWVLLVLPSGHQ